MKKVLTVLLILIVVLGGGGTILATQADASEPGDVLYAVDLAIEDVQRLLTFDDINLIELESNILEERVVELNNVVDTTDNIEEVLTAVTVQQDRVKDCLGNAESNPEKYQDGELERVQNQYQQQLEQHIQVMEKVENKGEDTALQVKQGLQENLDLCDTGVCGGSGSGNEDAGNTDSGSGSGNGNN
ncbi:TPA: hypothetical protein DEP90_02615 [Patescibacteria group bacterium]|nr:hypothetical protein [Patescibacteria group bacterium]